MNYSILQGDCIQTMKTLHAGSVQMVCTSPPYYGLRDYQTAMWEGGDPECDHKRDKDIVKAAARSSTLGGGKSTQMVAEANRSEYQDACGKCGARRIDDQIGLEETPEAYVAKLVEVFREVRRVLRDDGTIWVNLASSYSSGIIESEAYVMRDDLTTEEIAYVYRELAENFNEKSEAMSQVR